MLDEGAAAAISDRYGLGDDAVLMGPVARGEQGFVWRIETSLGTWAVKEVFAPRPEKEVDAEALFPEAAHGAGVPLPAIVRTVDDRVTLSLGGAQVRVYEWVDLFDPDANLDPAAVGRLVAAIHRVRVDAAGLPVHPWYTEPVGAARWDELIERLSAAGAPFAGDLARFRDELVGMEGWLEPPLALQMCHCDLWADNVRGTPSGQLCVIDWENSGPADPSQELCLLLYEFGNGVAARAKTLYESYLDAGGPGRVRRRGDFSTVIAQLGHINEMACRRWLSAGVDSEDRQHYTDRVAEFTARPLTRAVIDELLDAVASREAEW